MSGILVCVFRLYTGFTFSSNGCTTGGCVVSVKFYWPVFTILISVVQWACFQLGVIFANNGWVSEIVFEANHLKRYQIWRQFSYSFIHENEEHLWEVLTNQLVIGCCLEIINGWKPVALVYFDAACVADMVDFFSGTGIRGCGATGAVEGLYAAYLSTIILNWKEVSGATIRFSYLYLLIVCNFTAPFWYPILLGYDSENASNIGGALGGLVFGMCRVKIFRKRQWKNKMRQYCFNLAYIIMIFVLFSFFCNPFFYSNELYENYLGKLFALRELLMKHLYRF